MAAILEPCEMYYVSNTTVSLVARTAVLAKAMENKIRHVNTFGQKGTCIKRLASVKKHVRRQKSKIRLILRAPLWKPALPDKTITQYAQRSHARQRHRDNKMPTSVYKRTKEAFNGQLANPGSFYDRDSFERN